jgi:hypothetical protein
MPKNERRSRRTPALPIRFGCIQAPPCPLAISYGEVGPLPGLALARSLVELHDGSIEARSDGPGKGSEFIVRLPVHAVPGAASPRPLSDRKPHTGAARRVLVVDDVVDSALSLAALLRVDGNMVEIAHDGLEAVERAASFKPNLVLLDLGLPRLNGFEASSCAANLGAKGWSSSRSPGGETKRTGDARGQRASTHI